MPVSVNLLPDLGKAEGKKKKIVKVLSVISGGLILFTVLLVAGAYAFKLSAQNNYDTVTAEYDAQNALLKQHEATEIKLTEIKQRASKMSAIVSERKSYFNFMTTVEKITPKNVTYSEVSVDKNNTVALNGSCPSYDELLGFVKALSGEWTQLNVSSPLSQNTLFTNVKLVAASKDVNTSDVRFSITMTATKGVFDAQ